MKIKSLLKCAFLLGILMYANLFQTTFALSSMEDEEPYHASLSTEVFTFERNKSKSSDFAHFFSVQQKVKESLITEEEKVVFANALFFDNESEVLKVTAKMGRIKLPVTKTANSYQSDGIFHSDAKIYTYSFPLSMVDQTHCETVQEYRDFKYLSPVYFHTFYAVERKIIQVKVPEWLEVEIREFNFEEGKVSKRTFEEKGGVVVHEFVMTDLEARKRETNGVGRSYELPHIMILCKAIEIGGVKQTLLASTDDLYKWYRNLVKQVENDPKILEKTVEKVTAQYSEDQDKIEALFYWVQDNIRYIAFEDGIAGFKPATAQDVFNKRYGDCKGMSNLLKEMLTIAGYDARLTWLGTRRIAYDYSVPSLCVDNHMICTLIREEERIFLDPTEKYCPFGEFAHRIQGQQVMIEDEDTYELAHIPELDAEQNKTTKKITLDLEGVMLKGQATYEYFGEAKVELHNAYHGTKSDKKEEALKHYLSRGDKNRRVKNVETKHFDDRKKPLFIQHDFELDNEVMEVGEELYVTIDYGKMFKNAEMEEARKGDYAFGYRFVDTFDIHFNIPEGYSVSYLPENLDISNSDFDFHIQFTQHDDRIEYHKKIAVKSGVIPKSSFEDWDKAIKSLKSVYDDRIVLKKK